MTKKHKYTRLDDVETPRRGNDTTATKAPLYLGVSSGDQYNYADIGNGVMGLKNQRTGEVGTHALPEVVIRPHRYSSSFDGSLAGNLDVLNAMTGGVLNRLSPTQNARLVYDIVNGCDWRSSWMGNNGIVSNAFAKAHPLAAMLLNGAGDLGAAGGLRGTGRLFSGLFKMRGRTLTYTGVKGDNVANFIEQPNTNYDIWTADKQNYAHRYAKLSDDGKIKGKVFKIYGKTHNPLVVPTKDNYVMDWLDLPIQAKGDKLYIDNLFDIRNGDIYGSGKNNSVQYIKTYPEVRRLKVSTMPTDTEIQVKSPGHVRTNEVVEFGKQKGYDATIIKNVDDGAGIGSADDIVNEIIFHPNADVIKAAESSMKCDISRSGGRTLF